MDKRRNKDFYKELDGFIKRREKRKISNFDKKGEKNFIRFHVDQQEKKERVVHKT
jgi:hypothetical protein